MIDPLVLLAFVPQFVDPARGAVLGQFLILGAVLSLGGLLVNGAVGGVCPGAGLCQRRRFHRAGPAAGLDAKELGK